MRRRNLFWIAACIVIGLSACTTFRPASGPVRLDTERACADWRWIGIKSKPEIQCPEVPGWTVTPLFGQVAPPLNACAGPAGKGPGIDATIRELSRFCVYEAAGKSWGARPVPPAVSADLVRLDRDCASLSLSLDADLKGNIWKSPAEDYFQDLPARAGKPETPPKMDGPPNVRLAFLDTQPTGELPGEWWHSRHGYTLAQLARHLVCAPEGGDRCAAQITTQLALPVMRFDPKKKWKLAWADYKRGGYIGLQSDLATAIRKEVDRWQAESRAGSPRHLVLNVSLAWDGELFGGLGAAQIADMRAGTQAVYRALQYAADYDALVLAAAGNRKREPCANDGLLLPAAWETEAPRDGCSASGKGPLVYGVGGVQADGKPLANARLHGMPQRVAYGETEIFSGSSVATAVASSIAAVVWNTFPGFSSSEVMKILDDSGDALDGFPGVRRLSLCAALLEAERVCREDQDKDPNQHQVCPHQSRCDTSSRLFSSGTAAPATPGSCQPWLWPQPEDVPLPIGPPDRPY
jgi:hypothetical protein